MRRAFVRLHTCGPLREAAGRSVFTPGRRAGRGTGGSGRAIRRGSPHVIHIAAEADPCSRDGGMASLFRRSVRHEGDLCLAVLEFARKKLYPLEYEFKTVGTAQTVDDFAQEVAIEVWRGLERRKRTTANFYAWLNRICFTTAKDAGKGLRRATWEKEPLFRSFGDGEVVENPLLNRFSNVIDWKFQIPAWIEGTDRLVCELIRDGKDYAQIGKVLNLETQTVTNRVSLLRKRARAMKKNSKLFL